MIDSFKITIILLDLGEYATRDGDFGELVTAHVGAAIEDASFLISMERNSDLIIMSSYAPLFSNENDLRWTPNAIYFDGLISYATPAWWVQHLFSTKRGNIYIPTHSDGNNETFFHSAAINTATNTAVIKVVNNAETDVIVDADLRGVCRAPVIYPEKKNPDDKNPETKIPKNQNPDKQKYG